MGFVVSMPPRRSCFVHDIFELSSPYRGFNATTAFLLPAGGDPPGAAHAVVSMPPRRSCFRDRAFPFIPPVQRFNATTAFLLPSVVRPD